jgi:hypothetical protein
MKKKSGDEEDERKKEREEDQRNQIKCHTERGRGVEEGIRS